MYPAGFQSGFQSQTFVSNAIRGGVSCATYHHVAILMKIVLKSEPNDCEGSVNREMQLLQQQHTRPACMMSEPRFQSNTFILAPHDHDLGTFGFALSMTI